MLVLMPLPAQGMLSPTGKRLAPSLGPIRLATGANSKRGLLLMASNAVYLDLTLPVGGKKELPHPFYSYLSLSNLTFKKPFGRP
ncbi:hypothetical protein FH972_025324 [Carpinus fangiana]|jgi:hypothetical protein|uniref:Uncharacterized protein n=1 Tax=Carpinus fangiana TaxID=176857 RepID=A0A5N6L125_9ROSI|nr:hypothetical protein FH972_025324 [Carpinus fangiana]